MLQELVEFQPVIQADELYSAALVSMLPYMKEGDRWRVLSRLARARQTERAPVTRDVIEENPQKARAWFAAIGAKVVTREQ